MNPLYNNRTYYIKNSGSFFDLLRDISYDGDNVQGTREFVNTRIVINDFLERMSDISLDQMMSVEKLMKAIREQDGDMINSVYDSKYYLFLKDEMSNAKAQFRADCVSTRRAVISFPASHCFDSIQILIRGNEMITTVNMRSCNAYKNLICDLYLAHRLAFEIACNYTASKHNNLIANVGSLHIYKEDIKNVL